MAAPQLDYLFLGGLALVTLLLAFLLLKYWSLKSQLPTFVDQRARELNHHWQKRQLADLQEQLLQTALQQASAQLALWKAEQETLIRRDAVQRSQSVIIGKTTEHLVPYIADFHFNPRDVRFIGSPVDLIVFDGLNDGQVTRIVFIEVKTGRSTLSSRERRVRDAVRGGLVEWAELRLGSV